MHISISTRLVAALSILAAIAACANGYERFYQDNSASLSVIGYIRSDGEPRVVQSSGNPQADILRQFTEGYGLIGTSNFVGPIAGQNGAVSQAKKVGAARVVLWSRYQSTATGVMPITTPTMSTGFTNGTVNTFSPSGSAFGTYSGTTTIYGSETSYVPYSIARYDQIALYFVTLQRTGVGLLVGTATDDQKRTYGTNQMMSIGAVRNESPAFKANILPGDLLMSIDGRPIYDLDSYHTAVAAAKGREVDVLVGRGGERLTIKLTMMDGQW